MDTIRRASMRRWTSLHFVVSRCVGREVFHEHPASSSGRLRGHASGFRIQVSRQHASAVTRPAIRLSFSKTRPSSLIEEEDQSDPRTDRREGEHSLARQLAAVHRSGIHVISSECLAPPFDGASTASVECACVHMRCAHTIAALDDTGWHADGSDWKSVRLEAPRG